MSAQRVAHFQLVEKLGEGGMGEVWLADDLRLQRRVALKLLRGLENATPESRMRFAREARAAAALSHPGICVIYEAGEVDDETPFISMELVRGETLRARIARGPLRPSDAASIGAAIADALHAAHSSGVLHRDIKPANVMLTGDGLVKVLDFGLARLTPEGDDQGGETALRTATGAVMGTTSYMSPEQALGRHVDERSDIFSLGIVIFEMLTGRRPFDGATQAETLHRIIEANTVSVRSIDRSIPPHLDAVISRCLEAKPERRWRAVELAAALRVVQQAPRARTAGRWRSYVPTTLAVLAVLLAAAGVWIATSREGSKTSTAPGAMSAHAATTSARRMPDTVTIAVLPLTDIGGGSEANYFADGVTEEIINSLAQVKGLRVVSRTSSFVFKGARADIREVGRRLNVDKLVEGSVRHAGNRVRISIHLTNVSDGVQIWSDAYERDLHDIFALQEEIAGSVATALHARLDPGGAARAVDPEIYTSYLKGKHFLNLTTASDLRTAVNVLEGVTSRAPDFAPTYAALADAYLWLEHLSGEGRDHSYASGMAAARRAIELDPTLGDGYAALSHGLSHEGKMQEALAAADRALELSPSCAMAAQWRLLPLLNLHLPGILEQARRAVALDPLSVQTQGFAGLVLLEAGLYKPAIECLQAATELAPGNSWNLQILAMAYALDGQREKALNFASRAESSAKVGHLRDALAVRGMVLAAFGDPAARTLLASISTDGASGGLLRQLSRAWAAAGDTDRAVGILERMYRENPHYAIVNSHFPPHPLFAALRADPRYRTLRAKYGLSD